MQAANVSRPAGFQHVHAKRQLSLQYETTTPRQARLQTLAFVPPSSIRPAHSTPEVPSLPASLRMPRPGSRPEPPAQRTPSVDEMRAYNENLMTQVNSLVQSTNSQLQQLQPYGHRLTPQELQSIFRTLQATATRIQQMGSQAAQSQKASLQSMAAIQAAAQDFYNASSIYLSMAQGEAYRDAQNTLLQMRNAVANAQMNYSTVASDIERRVSALHPEDKEWQQFAVGFAPMIPPTSSGMGMMPMPGMMPASMIPSGPMPSGPMPASMIPSGPMPSGPMPASMIPSGPMPSGPMPASMIPSGPMPSGPMPASMIPSGPMPSGPMPAAPPTPPPSQRFTVSPAPSRDPFDEYMTGGRLPLPGSR